MRVSPRSWGLVTACAGVALLIAYSGDPQRANMKHAIARLRRLHAAQVAYRGERGRWAGSLGELEEAGHADPELAAATQRGYGFEIAATTSRDAWMATARSRAGRGGSASP